MNLGPSQKWIEAGFQGHDPANDFRGGGIFSLHNLLYMAQHHHATFQRLLLKADGRRSEWEYPFSVAGAHMHTNSQILLAEASALRLTLSANIIALHSSGDHTFPLKVC